MKSIKTPMAFFFALAVIPLALVALRAGQTVWEKNSDRNPASLNLSHLDGESFVNAARLRLVEGLEVKAQDSQHVVTAGHFQDNEGSICKSYGMIEYVFAADDSVVSGEPILMKVRGECAADGDASQLSALTIPYRKILLEQPSELTLKVMDRNQTEISFENMGDSWPRSWSLYSFRLFDENKSIIVTKKELFGFRGKPVQVRWPN